MKSLKSFITALAILAIFAGIAKAEEYKLPKNIIVFISDGWGQNTIDATNYYIDGATGTTCYEMFDGRFFMSTFPGRTNVKKDDKYWNIGYNPYEAWADFNNIKNGATGSAPAATSMATGVKSYYKGIGVDLDGNPVMNITEVAKAHGKSAGVVTSVEWTHATPAAFVAHNVHRDNYDQLGRSMLLDSKIDVIMGCGHPYFDNDGRLLENPNTFKYVGGEDAWTSLKNGETVFGVPSISGNNTVKDCDGDGQPDAWTLIENRKDFQNLMTGPTPKRVVGVAQAYETLQELRGGYNKADAFAVPFNANVPTLEEMTKAAINVLDNNEKGFFLMVEGGAVDWSGHANEPGRIIEEQHDFNKAVKAAYDWVMANGGWENTLIVVTGDHETGYLTGPNENDNHPHTNPIINNGKGNMPGMKFNSGSHTNQLIPFFAKGAGWNIFDDFADHFDPIRGAYLDNTELGLACMKLWPLPVHQQKVPKNVILMISDGWGTNQISSTNYWEGKTQRYQDFCVDMYMSTYLGKYTKGVDKDWEVGYNSYEAWRNPDYIDYFPTGSAAAASTMAAGKKTYYRSIGMDIDGKEMYNMTQMFKDMGKNAGVVSSVQFAHATPAAFVAHIPDRGMYADIANDMIFNSNVDVIMGCGNPYYDNDGNYYENPLSFNYVGGENTWNMLESGQTNWTLIQDREDFQNMATGSTPDRVIGVPKAISTLAQSRSGDGNAAAFEVPINQNIVTLEEMTKAALNVLDNNEKGFFLMVEGGAVDWAGHANQSGRLIEEQYDFNRACDAVIDWVEANGGWDQNLVIVTGDHETGYLTGPNGKNHNPFENPIIDNGAGNMPGMGWHSGDHTNQIIPFYAKGAGSNIFKMYASQIDRVHGPFIENSDLANGIFHIYNIHYPLSVSLTNKEVCRYEGVELGNFQNILGNDYNMAVSGGSGHYTINWHPNNQMENANTANPTTYNTFGSRPFMVTVKDNLTNQTVSGSMDVEVHNGIDVNINLIKFHPKATQLDLMSQIKNYNIEADYVWYDANWLKIDDPSAVFPNIGLTSYYVIAYDEMGCPSQAKKLIVFVSPRKDITEDDAVAGNNGTGVMFTYPNPVQNEINVLAEIENANDVKISIIDMAGKEISSFTSNVNNSIEQTIDVSNLNSGVYFLVLETEFDTFMKKFVK
jgi:alkaline phosphatase